MTMNKDNVVGNCIIVFLCEFIDPYIPDLILRNKEVVSNGTG